MTEEQINALIAMLGHTHGCKNCGWTGGYGQLRKRRAAPGTMPHPVCNCPQCDYEQAIAAFRYFSIEPATGQLVAPRTLSERLQNKDQ